MFVAVVDSMRELTRSLKPRIEERSALVCAEVEVLSVFTCKGINPGSTPGTQPRPALQSTNLYICIVPLKFRNFCVCVFFSFFLRGEGGNRKQCHSHPSRQASALLSSRRATPPPCCWTGRKHKMHQTPPPKKSDFLSSARSVNLGDKATIKHTSVGLKCAQKCARQSVRERGGKKQSWCAVTLQREGPSCAPDYGPFGSGGK